VAGSVVEEFGLGAGVATAVVLELIQSTLVAFSRVVVLPFDAEVANTIIEKLVGWTIVATSIVVIFGFRAFVALPIIVEFVFRANVACPIVLELVWATLVALVVVMVLVPVAGVTLIVVEKLSFRTFPAASFRLVVSLVRRNARLADSLAVAVGIGSIADTGFSKGIVLLCLFIAGHTFFRPGSPIARSQAWLAKA